MFEFEIPVSVPYRGILFFNGRYNIFTIGRPGFRPLSGNLIFQLEETLSLIGGKGFPSPIGESYFSIIRKVVNKNDN